MQYPVPQFTDVEDKLIANLSIKQFGIIFGVGIIIFAFYTVSKNLAATIVLAIILGLPGLAVTFGKLNGRPLYSSWTLLPQILSGRNTYIFHKQGINSKIQSAHTLEPSTEPVTGKDDNRVGRLKQLQYLLQQQLGEEEALLKKKTKESAKDYVV